MSYQQEREQFIATVTREGLPFHVAQALLRAATGINRRAELACSSEAADRDRVKCPAGRAFDGLDPVGRDKAIYDRRIASGKYPCLCDDYPAGSHAAGRHQDIPRITLQDWRAEERLRKLFYDYANRWTLQTSGDPRGYTLRVIPPSYAARNAGRDVHNLDAIGVPCRPSRLRF